MPQTAALIGTAIFNAIGLSSVGALTIAGTTLAEIVGAAVLATGLQYVGGLIVGTPSFTPESQKSNLRQPMPSRRKYYGTVKIGGVYAFRQVKDGYLYVVLMLGDGPFDEIVEHWLDDVEVSLVGVSFGPLTLQFVDHAQFYSKSGIFDGSFGGASLGNGKRVQIYTNLGEEDQLADPLMQLQWPDVWTSEHRLRGIANAVLICQTVPAENFTAVYKQGVPQYRCVANTSKVWDPRDPYQDADDPSTWKFSKNYALIILDHAWSDSGRRIPRQLFEMAIDDWKDKADICDEQVELAGGGTEPRFQLSGGYTFDEPAKAVAKKMEDAAGGRLRMRADGAAVLDLPVWVEPRVTITDDHILGYSSLRRGLDPGDTFNEIRAQYLSPENGYLTQESQPWRDEASIALNGVQSVTLDCTWSPSHRQTRARQKLEAARLNPEWIGTVITNAYGLNVIGERIINLQLSELGLDISCEVTSWKYNAANATCQIGIRSITENAFVLATGEQGQAPVSEDPGGDDDVPSPEITVSVGYKDFSGVFAPYLRIDAEPDETGRSLHLHAEYAVDGTDDWTPFVISTGSFSGSSASLSSEVYDVRAWFRAPSGKVSDLAEENDIEITGDILVTADGIALVTADGTYLKA